MTDDDPEDFCSAETVMLSAEQMAEIRDRAEARRLAERMAAIDWGRVYGGDPPWSLRRSQ